MNENENTTDAPQGTVNESPHEELPTKKEIREKIYHGNRDILGEADEIESVAGDRIEVFHEARDGEVIIQLEPEYVWLLDEDGEGAMRRYHDN